MPIITSVRGDVTSVTLQGATLAISPTRADHNSARRAIDSASGMVVATLNVSAAEFHGNGIGSRDLNSGWSLTPVV